MKKMLSALAAALAVTTTALALDFGPAPSDYQASAEAYVASRLDDAQGVRLQFLGDPYQVYADVAGYEDLPCWAVDVRIRAKLPNGTTGRYAPYTVLFLEGRAIALDEDARRLTRL